MTRAQRKRIDRLAKRHGVKVLGMAGDDVRVRLLDRQLRDDERVRVIRPSGLVEEPADIEGIE